MDERVSGWRWLKNSHSSLSSSSSSSTSGFEVDNLSFDVVVTLTRLVSRSTSKFPDAFFDFTNAPFEVCGNGFEGAKQSATRDAGEDFSHRIRWVFRSIHRRSSFVGAVFCSPRAPLRE
jgi:hypothetical protein